MTAIISLATILLTGVLMLQAGFLTGLLFLAGFLLATGSGAVVRMTTIGILRHPAPMYILAAAVLLAAYWLGRGAEVNLSVAGTSIRILGAWWCPVAGALSGFWVSPSDERRYATLEQTDTRRAED